MGCLKIPYDQEEGTIKSSPLKICRDIEENPVSSIFCVDYIPFGGTFNSSATSPENLYKYNGKEEQQETGWLDYGARMYDPMIGRFFTQDRFSEKYLDMTPYQYGANNPIFFIDVNGDSLAVTDVSQNGTAVGEMNSMVDRKTNGYYTTTTTSGGNTISQSTGKNDPNDPIGQEGQDFVTEFNGVANDSKTTTSVNITDNDANVLVVDLNTVTIDVGDLETVDAQNLPSKSGAGIMMHEVVEQQGMQNGISASTAHSNGIATENKVDGSTRTSYREGVTSDGHHVMMIGTTTSQGTSSTVRIYSKNKNVVTARER